MKISEMIAELTAIQQEHGDLDVEHVTNCCCYGLYSYDPELTVGLGGALEISAAIAVKARQ